jgi:hypothetical protein
MRCAAPRSEGVENRYFCMSIYINDNMCKGVLEAQVHVPLGMACIPPLVVRLWM